MWDQGMERELNEKAKEYKDYLKRTAESRARVRNSGRGITNPSNIKVSIDDIIGASESYRDHHELPRWKAVVIAFNAISGTFAGLFLEKAMSENSQKEWILGAVFFMGLTMLLTLIPIIKK